MNHLNPNKNTMKSILLSLLLVLTAFSSTFADAKAEYRRRCVRGLNNKNIAIAKLKLCSSTFYTCYERHGSCGDAYSRCTRTSTFPGFPNIAEVYADDYRRVPTLVIWDTDVCGGENKASELKKEKSTTIQLPNFVKHSQIGSNETIYDTIGNRIIVKNLRGKIGVTQNYSNQFSCAKIVVGFNSFSNEENGDSTIIPLYDSRVKLQDDKLSVQNSVQNGATNSPVFQSKDFQFYLLNNDVFTAEFDCGDVIFDIPASVISAVGGWKNLDIIVSLGTDAGDKDYGISNEYEITNEDWGLALQPVAQNVISDLAVYPNPSTNGIVSIKLSSSIDQTAQIIIRDGSGNLIKIVFDGNIKANSDLELTLADLNLNAGTYFVTAQLQSGIISKQLYVQ